MLPATLASPSDINPALCPFKSILSTCTAGRPADHSRAAQAHRPADHQLGPPAATSSHQQRTGQLSAATTGHQQATACLHWAELGRSADQAKNPAKSGQKQARSKGKNTLHMTLYIFPEKSIIKPFHYCMYTALYNHSTTFSLLYMYSNTKSLHKNDDFLAYVEVDPPLPKIVDPFFSRSHFGFFPCK